MLRGPEYTRVVRVSETRLFWRARHAWLGAISVLAACHDVRVDPFSRQVGLDSGTTPAVDAGKALTQLACFGL